MDTADVADSGSIDDTPPHVRTPAAGGGGPSEGGRGERHVGEAGAAGKETAPVGGAAGMASPPPTAVAVGANLSAPQGGVAAGAGGEIGTQAGSGAGAAARAAVHARRATKSAMAWMTTVMA
ncbi:MAG TPA: hypothetical protein VJV78_42585 [Polyangiales bacterium]|nr:hypothetical protein [Polyangiales bacterium]